ncbi:MAG: hypothetical protein WA758_09750, partial [Candidatus Acidiferrales bacterium]
LYQLKNAQRAHVRPRDMQRPAPTVPPQASAQAQQSPAPPPKAQAAPTDAHSEAPTKPRGGSERRKWERVSLAGTKAYAVIAGNEKKTATVVDLCTGGLALIMEGAEDVPSPFFAVLHVPILPPLRVNLRKVYTRKAEGGSMRVGCTFVS